MFTKADSAQKTAFLEQTKAAREERAQEKQREEAAIKIQATVRGFIARIRLRTEIWQEVDILLEIPKSSDAEYKPALKPALVTFAVVKRFLFLFNEDKDAEKFQYLCKYILYTMSSDQVKFSYVSVALSKSHVLAWIEQLKDVLWHCCRYLKILKPESVSGIKAITVYLHMLLTFSNTATWKILHGKAGEALKPGMSQLCNNVMGYLNSRGLYPVFQSLLIKGLARSKPSFTKGTLSAMITVAIRPLVAANFSDSLLTVFLLHILSVPAVVYHTSLLAQECLSVLVTHRLFRRSLDLLCNEQSTRIIFNSLEGNYALCLLANLIQLADAEIEGLVESTPNFLNVVNKLLECCERYVQSKQSNLTHWHPVLGWFSQETDQSLHEAMPGVTKQLQLLWSPKIVKILLSDLLTHNQCKAREGEIAAAKQQSKSTNIIKKALEKASTKSSSSNLKLNSPVALATCAACGMYQTALRTLTQLRLDILAGLSYQDLFLPNLWGFFCDFGPNCGLNAFIELLTSSPNNTHHPVFQMLTLFCDAASHLIVILDDVELYDQQRPFKLDDVISMTSFLNQFIFKIIWNNLIDVKTAPNNPLFSSPHTLLMLLSERDCRRRYTPDKHWLIRDVKPSAFLQELERGRKTAQFLLQKTPHIIPHKERVILFRKNVQKEKEVMGLTESVCASPTPTSIVTVHRSRIIEDGYRQLSLLPAGAMKGIIRVRFINAQGLDEAGIDQDGVFKEFLEETIARVFNPSLNLFKVTSDQKLYPSPTSAIQENHLTLFEFVGRMLGKAVYEGIVVDVPFAPFFLTQILGRKYSSMYSFMDELPSLDPELYKNLTYVKHYEGDVSDIELTFSSMEDFLGQLVTHELVPGGKAISVTNENKISYVHQMAHFRMHVQIKEQTAAFIHGFKSLVNPEWLLMFSAPELQKLISGDNTDMDIEDLKSHTQYYGGFHSSHKVVNWLWDILAKDFTREERSLFLKFVTSCSKPPLLGFANLEPPFSIRCVEVSDDQDTGDTVGSVLKGFFNIRKKDPVGRLPTSSTCFNLLKLPNYQKKSTLREKLRYAITSNTGFELS